MEQGREKQVEKGEGGSVMERGRDRWEKGGESIYEEIPEGDTFETKGEQMKTNGQMET